MITLPEIVAATRPTISEVKPDGTGDFSTLQAWEDWADGQSSADQTAECYDGGDLGVVTLYGWSATPDSNNRPTIRVPLAERHSGQDGTGAYIDQGAADATGIDIDSLDWVRIEGIRIKGDRSGSGMGIATSQTDNKPDNLDVDSCMVNRTYNYAIYCFPSGTYNCRNNILYYTQGAGIVLSLIDADPAGTVYCENNTLYRVGEGWGYYGIGETWSSTQLTTYMRNNVVLSCGGDDFKLENSGKTTWTESKSNMSSDGTADDFGGSGHMANKSASNQFVDPDSDWNLLSDADALDAGTSMDDFDHDAVHEDTDDWRPQGSAWDMGALELEQSSGTTVEASFGLIVSAAVSANALAAAEGASDMDMIQDTDPAGIVVADSSMDLLSTNGIGIDSKNTAEVDVGISCETQIEQGGVVIGEGDFQITSDLLSQVSSDAESFASTVISSSNYLSTVNNIEIDKDVGIGFNPNLEVDGDAQSVAEVSFAIDALVSIISQVIADTEVDVDSIQSVSIDGDANIDGDVGINSIQSIDSNGKASVSSNLNLSVAPLLSIISNVVADSSVEIDTIQSITVDSDVIKAEIKLVDGRTFVVQLYTKTFYPEDDRNFEPKP